MEGKWTCPQCETLNESTDNCIVCGMAYHSAVEAYRRHNSINNTVETTVSEPAVTDESSKSKLMAVLSIILGVISFLMYDWFVDDEIIAACMTALVAAIAILTGKMSLNYKFNAAAIVGMVMGIICLLVIVGAMQ